MMCGFHFEAAIGFSGRLEKLVVPDRSSYAKEAVALWFRAQYLAMQSSSGASAVTVFKLNDETQIRSQLHRPGYSQVQAR
jgi:hypothetical protein